MQGLPPSEATMVLRPHLDELLLVCEPGRLRSIKISIPQLSVPFIKPGMHAATRQAGPSPEAGWSSTARCLAGAMRESCSPSACVRMLPHACTGLHGTHGLARRNKILFFRERRCPCGPAPPPGAPRAPPRTGSCPALPASPPAQDRCTASSVLGVCMITEGQRMPEAHVENMGHCKHAGRAAEHVNKH